VYLNKFSKRSLILEYVVKLTSYLDKVHKLYLTYLGIF